jgi:ABC-2 type transport system ATP-binding protein
METVLEVENLLKRYGSLTAVKGISFSVKKGEIFGLLGHNGAGKTTAIECILGTRRPDGGCVRLLGMDPAENRKKVFARVGVQFQDTRFQDKLRVREACEVTASLYPHTQDWHVLLDRFFLGGRKDAVISSLSGGERQKLAVVLALIPEPEALFLDELTTGLDPGSRRMVWEYLRGLKKSGVSIILTSHYMDEVEYLCDRIALMRDGSFAAQGKPDELMKQHNAARLEDVFLLYMGKEEEAY